MSQVGPREELARQRQEQSKGLELECSSSVPGAAHAEGRTVGQEVDCAGG